MITFILCIALLLIGYFVYGKIVDKHFGMNPSRLTPAVEMEDGVDYKPLPAWKVFMVQFLNIAGLGPIFGAILGAAYGPVAYLWIVLGCIFCGAVHDYFSGMLSIRHKGANMPQLSKQYLARGVKALLVVVTIFLLFCVGVSFVTGPSDLLAALSGWDKRIWLVIIFAYYILATVLPVDKIIGSIYPIFGAVLLFMAVSVAVMMVVGHVGGSIHMQELSLPMLRNFHSDPANNVMIPMLFVVISCGALSGFHSTQSPIMARCLVNEKYGRPVFYGAMIAEGIVAMIWASAAMAYFGGPEALNRAATDGIELNGVITKVTPAIAVNMICNSWLGKVGAVLAIIGVVVCPITSGDTAFRGLRINISELAHIPQKRLISRLLLSLPIFALALLCCKMDFQNIWKFMGIANQMMATFVLWIATSYLISRGKNHLMTSIPAAFMSFVCLSYFLAAPVKNGGLHLAPVVANCAGIASGLALFVWFCIKGLMAKRKLA